MALYLIRHAKAGDRSTWDGDDRVRPLTSSGRLQAERLAGRFVGVAVERVLSSPFTRCRQTVAPIAAARNLQVEPTPSLSEEIGRTHV